MSFSWFVLLHFPILFVLVTGNTSLARSIWPESFFEDEDEPAAAGEKEATLKHPPPYGAWYPIAFFLLLVVTVVTYFTAAFSYPGYVDEEYWRKRASSEGGDVGGHARGRNGYARVGVEEPLTQTQRDDVRIDIPSSVQVRRILVDASPVSSDTDDVTTVAVTPSSIPASLLGEADEAAELSIGCAPPLVQPVLASIGLSRAQLHTADQTAEEQSVGPVGTGGPSEVELSEILPPRPAAASRTPTALPTSTANGYCSMCHLVRPARAKHCYKCRHCVTKFDHHCPFVANCIGARNHRYFLAYLWSQVSILLWAMSLNTEPYLYPYTTREFYQHAGVMVIMVAQLMVSSMLCLFHSWMAVTNQTTYQVIKMQDLGSSPELTAIRRTERRERSRRLGDVTSDEDDVDPPSEVDQLTWRTYHVGFFRNVWRFLVGTAPDEHLLPRSVREPDDTWTHLPHAIHEVRPRPIPAPLASSSPPPASHVVESRRSTVFHLTDHNGLTFPTTAAEVATFPETPPMPPREAYTRPARILGHAKLQLPPPPVPTREPDTDEETVESVQL